MLIKCANYTHIDGRGPREPMQGGEHRDRYAPIVSVRSDGRRKESAAPGRTHNRGPLLCGRRSTRAVRNVQAAAVRTHLCMVFYW